MLVFATDAENDVFLSANNYAYLQKHNTEMYCLTQDMSFPTPLLFVLDNVFPYLERICIIQLSL